MLRLVLSLLVCIPVGAVLGGLHNLDLGERATYIGVAVGALLGLILGWAVGADGKVAEFIFGPKAPESVEDFAEDD